MRNSVKVTVDAYDGTMTYYADLDEPIVQVWSRVYPDLFTDDRRPLRRPCDEHFRYPENLFQAQATRFATYHVSDPSVFYQNQDRWEIAADPTRGGFTPEGTTTATSLDTAPRLRPYYLLMKAPGETDGELPARGPVRAEGSAEHGGVARRGLRSRDLRSICCRSSSRRRRTCPAPASSSRG